MDREKLIVVLLLVAVVLSVASILITSNLSADEIENITPNIVPDDDHQAASVSLVVAPSPNAGGGE